MIELNNEPNEVNDATFPDAESRIKSSNHFLQDSFDNQQSNPRFIYAFGSPANFYNPFFKTATFQLTSTVTLTTINRCVPSIQFAVSPPPACRRKRNVIDDPEDVDQFIIDPSETLEYFIKSLYDFKRPYEIVISFWFHCRLTATALPGRQSRETRQVMDKSNSDDSLISSQNAEIPFGEMSKVDQFMANLRDKRFFLNKNSFFTSTTMTSYTFISTTITQTVSLGPGSAAIPGSAGPPVVPEVPAVPGVLRCLPAGYSVCP